MKKAISLILVCALFLLVLTACGGDTSPSSSTPAASSDPSDESHGEAEGKEKITYDKHLDIEFLIDYDMAIAPSDEIVALLNEKFNVTLNCVCVNAANYAQTLQMRVAGQDVPDWFRLYDSTFNKQFAEDGISLNVSDYVEKYDLPNLEAQLKLPYAELITIDGSFYGVPATTGYLTFGLYIRQDWLNELDLEYPKTWDDFTKMLQAFVDKDPDGKNTTGVTTYANGFWTMIPCWTGYNTWGYVNDEFTFYAMDPNFKDCVKYWSGLYTSGLMDPEQFSNSYEQAMQKFDSGRSGVLIMNAIQTWYDNNRIPLQEYKPDAEIGIIVPVPEGPAGSYVNHGIPLSASYAFNANMDEEKKLRCLAIADYLLSDEGRELTLYGFEGKQHTVVDGKKVQVDDITQQWGQNIHVLGSAIDFGSSQALTTAQPILNWFDYLDDHAKYNAAQFISSSEVTKYNVQMNEVFTKWITPFLTGEVDIDSNWDTYLQEMKDAGMDEITRLTEQYVIDNGLQDKFPHVTR